MHYEKTDQQIINELKSDLSRLQSTRRQYYDDHRSPSHLHSASICRRLHMSWRQVIHECHLWPARTLAPKHEMIQALKQEFQRLGSTTKITYRKYRDKERFPYPEANETFKYDMVRNHSGLRSTRISQVTSDNVSDEQLIDEYLSLCHEFGKIATVRELQMETKFSYDVYRQHFSTIHYLRERAGLDSSWQQRPSISKNDCMLELVGIYKIHGRLPYADLQEESRISISTIFRRFGTTKINCIWDEVMLYFDRYPL